MEDGSCSLLAPGEILSLRPLGLTQILGFRLETPAQTRPELMAAGQPLGNFLLVRKPLSSRSQRVRLNSH